MDLSLIQDQLDNFETFGENIGKVLQGIPEVLSQVLGWFVTPEGEDESVISSLSSVTGDNVSGLSSTDE